MRYTQEQNLLFYKYIQQYYDNYLLDLLVKKYSKGVNQRVLTKIENRIEQVDKYDKINIKLFYFILHTRVKENSTINSLGWQVFDRIDTEGLDTDTIHDETSQLIKDLGLPELEIDEQVMKNASYYIRGF